MRDQILLHVKDPRSAPLGRLSSSTQGVVFSGQEARKNLRNHALRHGSLGPLVLDPSAYEKELATPDAPFALAQPSLFEKDPLTETLGQLEDDKAALVLTPTRYLNSSSEGVSALRRAVKMINTVERTNLVLSVPLDAAWLTERPDDLISLLNEATLPKALILGSTGNPVGSRAQAASLRRIIRETEDTALLRTDMTAIDTMIHGAAFASIGDTSSTRRTYPPRQRSFVPNPSDTSPNILVPGLLSYYRGAKLAVHLREDIAFCTCWSCVAWSEGGNGNLDSPGRSITSFRDKEDTNEAHAHNLDVWSEIWRELRKERNPYVARLAWQQLCADALSHHEVYNRTVTPRGSVFRPPPALRFWAGSVS
ncbi:hypothetical protein [Nocardiopsis sp. NPDC006938]|uniref:hypothetical protein n=1 Tax=Nocardiopsis sp. NPDC006938 TaxID=3364337 RepID=UPI0036A6922E